jgi:hypothetical protein
MARPERFELPTAWFVAATGKGNLLNNQCPVTLALYVTQPHKAINQEYFGEDSYDLATRSSRNHNAYCRPTADIHNSLEHSLATR